jgi:hypothetical protein
MVLPILVLLAYIIFYQYNLLNKDERLLRKIAKDNGLLFRNVYEENGVICVIAEDKLKNLKAISQIYPEIFILNLSTPVFNINDLHGAKHLGRLGIHKNNPEGTFNFAPLVHHPLLSKLRLDNVSEADIASLPSLENLQEIELKGANKFSLDKRLLKQFPSLKVLALQNINVSDIFEMASEKQQGDIWLRVIGDTAIQSLSKTLVLPHGIYEIGDGELPFALLKHLIIQKPSTIYLHNVTVTDYKDDGLKQVPFDSGKATRIQFYNVVLEYPDGHRENVPQKEIFTGQ